MNATVAAGLCAILAVSAYAAWCCWDLWLVDQQVKEQHAKVFGQQRRRVLDLQRSTDYLSAKLLCAASEKVNMSRRIAASGLCVQECIGCSGCNILEGSAI